MTAPNVAVLLNDGSGGFSTTTYPVSTYDTKIAAGDIMGVHAAHRPAGTAEFRFEWSGSAARHSTIVGRSR